MTNKENLKKQIIYRSLHRGTKEMDILLGNFVKKYINNINYDELLDLEKLMHIDDEIIHKWYFNNKTNQEIDNLKISRQFKSFKL